MELRTDTKLVLETGSGDLTLKPYKTKSSERDGFKMYGVLSINGISYQLCNAILSPRKNQPEKVVA